MRNLFFSCYGDFFNRVLKHLFSRSIQKCGVGGGCVVFADSLFNHITFHDLRTNSLLNHISNRLYNFLTNSLLDQARLLLLSSRTLNGVSDTRIRFLHFNHGGFSCRKIFGAFLFFFIRLSLRRAQEPLDSFDITIISLGSLRGRLRSLHQLFDPSNISVVTLGLLLLRLGRPQHSFNASNVAIVGFGSGSRRPRA